MDCESFAVFEIFQIFAKCRFVKYYMNKISFSRPSSDSERGPISRSADAYSGQNSIKIFFFNAKIMKYYELSFNDFSFMEYRKISF